MQKEGKGSFGRRRKRRRKRRKQSKRDRGDGRKKEKAKGGGQKKKLDDQNFVSILQSSAEWPGLELTCRDCIRVGYV